jgi:hypothetical protein
MSAIVVRLKQRHYGGWGARRWFDENPNECTAVLELERDAERSTNVRAFYRINADTGGWAISYYLGPDVRHTGRREGNETYEAFGYVHDVVEDRYGVEFLVTTNARYDRQWYVSCRAADDRDAELASIQTVCTELLWFSPWDAANL